MYDRYVVELEDGTVGQCEFAKVGSSVVVLVKDEKGHTTQVRGKVKLIVEEKDYK